MSLDEHRALPLNAKGRLKRNEHGRFSCKIALQFKKIYILSFFL